MTTKPGCKICGKILKDDDALLGPDCQAHYDEALAAIGATDLEISRLFLLGDPTVDSWLKKMRNALYTSLRRPAEAASHQLWANNFLRNARLRAERVAHEMKLRHSVGEWGFAGAYTGAV